LVYVCGNLKTKKMNSRYLSIMAFAAAMGNSVTSFESYESYSMPKFKRSTGKRVDVRTEPKIGRNDICPKCDSGIKYKKCCGASL
jgi:uncharacterized protein YecA (UPF0149 family)